MKENPIPKKPGFSVKRLPWKKILIGVGIVLILAVIYFLFLFRAAIEIEIEPADALIEIDNREFASGVVKARPGNREIKISAPGYETYQKRIVIRYFSNQPLVVKLKEIPAFKQLDQGKLSFLSYDQEKNTLFYLKNEAAYRINLNLDNLSPEKISPNYFKDIKKMVWAKDHEAAIVQLKNSARLKNTLFAHQNPKGQYSTWYYDFKRYDLLHQQARQWEKGIGDFDLASDRKRVAYFYTHLNQEQSLILSPTSQHRPNRVAKLERYGKPKISWSPNKQHILITAPHRIALYDTFEDELSEIAVGGDYQEGMVAPNSEQILYISPGAANTTPLSLMNIEGKEKQNLNLDGRLNNIGWINEKKFCGAGYRANQPILFCYNTNKDPEEAVEELSWQRLSSVQFNGLAVSEKNQELYLIKNNHLVSITITPKEY